MSAAMNKENLINQLPSSPYTPTQKVRSRKNSQITPKLLPPLTVHFNHQGLKVSTPQKNNATKFKVPLSYAHASSGCLA